MGNQNCQSSKAIQSALSKQVHNQYELIERKIDSTLGDVLIVRDPSNGKCLAVREKIFPEGQKDMTIYAKKFLKFQKSSHKNLVEIVKVEQHQGGAMCSGCGIVCIALEYYPKNLKDEILRRKQSKSQVFQATELLFILKSLVSALTFMQIHRRVHQRICLESVYVNNSGEIKLLDPRYADCEFLIDQFEKSPQAVVECGFFVPPSQMQFLANISQRNKQEDINLYKADVFSLGCLIIQLASNSNLSEVFDYVNYFVCADTLEKHIQAIRKNLSEQLSTILQCMVTFQESQRPDFIELAQYLGIISSITASNSPVEINYLPLKNKENQMSSQLSKISLQNNNSTREGCSEKITPHIVKNMSNINSVNHEVVSISAKENQSPLSTPLLQSKENKQFLSLSQQTLYSQLKSNQTNSLTPHNNNLSFSQTPQYQRSSQDEDNFSSNKPANKLSISFLNFERQQNKSNPQQHQTEFEYNNSKEPSILICDTLDISTQSISNKLHNLKQTQGVTKRNSFWLLISYLQNSKRNVIGGGTEAEEDCVHESVESNHPHLIQRFKSIHNPFNGSIQLQGGNTSAFLKEYEGELSGKNINQQQEQQFQQVKKIGNLEIQLEDIPPLEQSKEMNLLSNNSKEECSIEIIGSYTYVNEQYNNSSQYIGYKCRGLRHGRGQMIYSQGGRYDGEWKEGKMNGYGTLYYSNNEIAFEGEFKDDQFNGQGKLRNLLQQNLVIDEKDINETSNISSLPWIQYSGSFVKDIIQGEGLMLFYDNRKYYGNFANGLPHGQGIFFDKDDLVLKKGIWEKGILVQSLI